MTTYSTSQPLDILVGTMLEAQEYGSAMYVALEQIRKLIGEERLAHAGELAPAKPRVSLTDTGYERVKHLLYGLLQDHLPVRTLREAVEEACREVEMGGIVMDEGEETIAARLAIMLDGALPKPPEGG